MYLFVLYELHHHKYPDKLKHSIMEIYGHFDTRVTNATVNTFFNLLLGLFSNSAKPLAMTSLLSMKLLLLTTSRAQRWILSLMTLAISVASLSRSQTYPSSVLPANLFSPHHLPEAYHCQGSPGIPIPKVTKLRRKVSFNESI